ncbi:nucleotide-binding protein [Cohnella silvisoli]|uniref:Nucleotide-binding protein n=1 Tax=Cohnella silvisoli TaxID=2873699 RepID=A0ABV1KPA9_9BACL|nr:nucleotide-binding protein [Cohnella silvisoli]MCD9020211.1 nucleotide-binding protein [Cohnella silvisoli]
MKVFIGSSVESLKDLRMIARLIEEEGHEPIPWNKPGIFPLGNYLFESLVEVGSQIDAAILIFNEDDQLWYRGDGTKQPRDNVLIEYGFFAGKLGTKRTIICRRGFPKMATDLNGLIYCDLNKEFKAQDEILE